MEILKVIFNTMILPSETLGSPFMTPMIRLAVITAELSKDAIPFFYNRIFQLLPSVRPSAKPARCPSRRSRCNLMRTGQYQCSLPASQFHCQCWGLEQITRFMEEIFQLSPAKQDNCYSKPTPSLQAVGEHLWTILFFHQIQFPNPARLPWPRLEPLFSASVAGGILRDETCVNG
jgi:hypothetical protein